MRILSMKGRKREKEGSARELEYAAPDRDGRRCEWSECAGRDMQLRVRSLEEGSSFSHASQPSTISG
jgi:hypothetical protein